MILKCGSCLHLHTLQDSTHSYDITRGIAHIQTAGQSVVLVTRAGRSKLERCSAAVGEGKKRIRTRWLRERAAKDNIKDGH